MKSRAWMRFPDGERIAQIIDALVSPAQDMHGDFHADCVKAIETKLQVKLKNIHRSLYVSGDETGLATKKRTPGVV